MSKLLDGLIRGEGGATMVEYALMVALIGAALVAVVTSLKTSMGGKFSGVSSTIGGTS